MALCNPIYSNPLGQLEQCGDAPGGKDTEGGGSLKSGESSPAKQKCQDKPHGISHVGLSPEIFFSSAHSNSKGSVVGKLLTTSKCLVWFRVSLWSMALP